MSTTAERLQRELATLSEFDRAELARFLIQSLQTETDADAEEAWDVELERRARQVKTGQAKGEPAEKVFSDLRAKHS
jgi:putative addiction module component (TIGR02574 family)